MPTAPGGRAPSNEIERAYATLGLQPGAPRPDVEAAYRELRESWALDRFKDAPRLLPEAERRLREGDKAFALLVSHLDARRQDPRRLLVPFAEAGECLLCGSPAPRGERLCDACRPDREAPAPSSPKRSPRVGWLVLIGIAGFLFADVYAFKVDRDAALLDARLAQGVARRPSVAELLSAHHVARAFMLLNAGDDALARQQLPAAIAFYRQSLRANSRLVFARHGLAHSLCEARRYDEAIAEYREVIRLDPYNLSSLTGMLTCVGDLTRGQLGQWNLEIGGHFAGKELPLPSGPAVPPSSPAAPRR